MLKLEVPFRFAAIASSSPDTPNLFKRPTGMQGASTGASSSGNVSNAQAAPSATAIDDSRMDSAAHRALLRNELLCDNIDDIRVRLFRVFVCLENTGCSNNLLYLDVGRNFFA